MYTYIYEEKTSACMCSTVIIKEKSQSFLDDFSYLF